MSFFKSKSASTSKSSTELSSASSVKSEATDHPKTHEILVEPSEESSIEELKEYSQTLLLPESDPYYCWERRFLLDPGTHPRYMRAAKWKMPDAKNRIKTTLEWRRQYKPELIEPGDVSIEAETGKIILSGFDIDSRPILYMRPGRENTETSPRQIRHLIYHLERAIDLMPPGQEQVAIIVDYKSATSQSNPSISTARKVLSILQNHYVERLGRGLVVNMPQVFQLVMFQMLTMCSWWINAFFSGITPFLDPITRDKIRFNPKLTDFVPPSHLDVEFGGDYNLEYDHKVYWPTLTEFCHIAEDGTRVKDGQPWVPPSGNGIKAAYDGYLPRPGCVVSGDIIQADEQEDSAAGKHAVAVVTGAASDGAKDSDTLQEGGEQTEAQRLAKQHNASVVDGTGTLVEDDMAKLAIETAPGPPVVGLFNHPPTEKEKDMARRADA
nr:pleiotropic drug resistance protein [Cryptococcus depauperatus CBS 7855]